MRSLLPPLPRLTAVVIAVALLMGAMVALARPADAGISRHAFRVAVVELTNVERIAAGCKPLKRNKHLRKAAQKHARSMARKDYFSHSSFNGKVWWKRIMRWYKDPGGENIARGYGSPHRVVRAWMDSPGHRRNIRNCQFRKIGVGFDRRGDYSVQDFGY